MDVATRYREQVEEVKRLTQEMKNPDGSLKESVTKEDVDRLHLVVDKLAAIRKKYKGKFQAIGEKADKQAKEAAAHKASYQKVAAQYLSSGKEVLARMAKLAHPDGTLKDGVTDEDIHELVVFMNGLPI